VAQKTCHFNQRSIVEMNEKDLVEDLSKISHESKICETCQQGKQTKLQFSKNQVWIVDQKLQPIHTYVCDPMKIESLNGNKYFFVFIDDCTRMCWVYFIKFEWSFSCF